ERENGHGPPLPGPDDQEVLSKLDPLVGHFFSWSPQSIAGRLWNTPGPGSGGPRGESARRSPVGLPRRRSGGQLVWAQGLTSYTQRTSIRNSPFVAFGWSFGRGGRTVQRPCLPGRPMAIIGTPDERVR